jgi:L-fuconolactonase
MPSFQKIDVHQHFWKYDPLQYGWISNEMGILKRDFLPEDLQSTSLDSGYGESITVQARQTIEETEWLLNLADENRSIRGVVGWLDLCSPNIHDQLTTFSRKKHLKGVRHVLQDEPDDNFMLRRNFLAGLDSLGATDLLYELLIFPKHLKNSIRLVELFPKQVFVLDHCAKPFIKSGKIQEWADQINKLSSFENVHCKVSGLVTEADWQSWKPADFDPYLDVIWNSFGQDRIMIGSDWPVCLVAGTYSKVMLLADEYFKKQGSEVLDRVCRINAINTYRLQKQE